jgi:hypothetical protein
MMTVKSKIEAKDPAHVQPFAPSTSIPATDTQRAIELVQAAVDLAQGAADAARELALQAVGGAATAMTFLRQVRTIATMARDLAMQARGSATDAHTKLRKLDDVQIVLKAQVFN